jgi:peptidoglycan/xylan/chitin deacetylase (PgdA/CDA1 family)
MAIAPERPEPATAVAAILMYHRIAGQEPAGPRAVSLDHFEQHLQVLRGGDHTVLPLISLAARATGHDLPPRAVAITFDDGYANAIAETVDALARYRAPATFFIVSGALEKGEEFWWDTVDGVLSSDRRLPDSLALRFRSELVSCGTATDEERREARSRISHLCFDASREERDGLMTDLVAWSGYSPSPHGPRPMTAGELRHLAAAPGIDIGAHTENHVWLPKQPVNIQQSELVTSKARLEHILGCPIVSLAYPYGAHDATTVAAARRAGFAVAVTAGPGPVTARTDPLALPRFEVRDDDARGFAAFLSRILGSVGA